MNRHPEVKREQEPPVELESQFILRLPQFLFEKCAESVDVSKTASHESLDYSDTASVLLREVFSSGQETVDSIAGFGIN
uniref:Uncharacterized protein n=1 Tax=Timema poppense TaxID=170557 RepID=A0A7R9DAZ2_TIMPO|nr:unnamed protein product [Timema poppensis]